MSSSKEQKTQPTEENSSVEDDDLEDYAEAEEDPDLEIKELKSLIKNSCNVLIVHLSSNSP